MYGCVNIHFREMFNMTVANILLYYYAAPLWRLVTGLNFAGVARAHTNRTEIYRYSAVHWRIIRIFLYGIYVHEHTSTTSIVIIICYAD